MAKVLGSGLVFWTLLHSVVYSLLLPCHDDTGAMSSHVAVVFHKVQVCGSS